MAKEVKFDTGRCDKMLKGVNHPSMRSKLDASAERP